MKINRIIIIILFISIGPSLWAQGGFNVNVQAKSMHYWRGLRVTNGLMTGTSVGYFGENFSAYAWGGLSVDGDYKEVTGVVSYASKNFSTMLIDIYNFSGMRNMDYFNYNGNISNHIIDLTLAYDFSAVNVAWSTVLFGNDRIPATGDFRYSTYVEIGVPVMVNESSVTPFIAPAFALNPDANAMLYGNDESFGIANVGLKVHRDVTISEYTVPVSAVLGFNTALNQASIQVAANLF